MEKRLVPFNGIGVQTSDIATLADNAALADDRILAELIRPKHFLGTVQKMILPSARSGRVTTQYITGSAVVIPSGAATSTTFVRGFRAIVGIQHTITELGSTLAGWRDIRSAIHSGGSSTANVTVVTHDATASNHRWDLIWARVDLDVDLDPVQRYVKSGGGVVSSQNVTPYKVNTLTIGVTKGAESASPTRPALPTDVEDNSYYFPLAYVLLQHPHTLTDAITAEMIWEVAPVIGLGEAMGVSALRPASGASDPGGYAESIEPWSPSGRSGLHIPSTMVGGATRFFSVLGLPVGTTVLDDSIDWRRRWFKWLAQASSGVNTLGPGYAVPTRKEGGLSNSIPDAPSSGTVVRLLADDAGIANSALILPTASSADLTISVNASTGALEAVNDGATPFGHNVFLWIEATGAWDNAA